MKRNYLTIEKVNENLQKLFPGEPIQCTKADVCKYKPYDNSNYSAEYFYYIIETPKQKLAVGDDKKVYSMLADDEMQKYKYERERFNLIHKEIEIFGETYTEWINKAYAKNKEAEEQCDMILIATGYKQPKKEETTEQKLKRLMGINYVKFYKLAKEVKVTGYEFKKGTQYRGTYKLPEPATFDVLVVKHSTGSFSFPVTQLLGNDYQSADTFVQDAFCDLLGIANPYTVAAMEEIKVKVIPFKPNTKCMAFVKRLRTLSLKAA